MKKVIVSLLSNGFTKTKKYTEQDILKFLYPLKHVIKTDSTGLIMIKENKFWGRDNAENRKQFIRDVLGIYGNGKNIMKGTMFNILNRFENGDAYGMEKFDDDLKGIEEHWASWLRSESYVETYRGVILYRAEGGFSGFSGLGICWTSNDIKNIKEYIDRELDGGKQFANKRGVLVYA